MMSSIPLKMPRGDYSEDDIVNAIFDITDNGLSHPQASQKHGVPRQTIQNRLRGIGPQGEQEQSGQRVSKAQEARLAQWILRQEALGYAPSNAQIRACVTTLLQKQGDTEPLGKNWVSRFIERTPEVKNKMGKRQEAARFNNFTPKAVNWYFDVREDFSWIKPENTVNVDKGGIMAGFGKLTLYILAFH